MELEGGVCNTGTAVLTQKGNDELSAAELKTEGDDVRGPGNQGRTFNG